MHLVRDAGLGLVIGLTVALAVVASAEPATDYVLHCQGCHLPAGRGAEHAGVPDLAGQVARFLRVPGGREYLVRVPGVAQASLEDEALAALLNFVLRRFDAADLPADFEPYGAREVGRLRGRPLDEVTPTRERLLQALAAQPASPR